MSRTVAAAGASQSRHFGRQSIHVDGLTTVAAAQTSGRNTTATNFVMKPRKK